MNFNVDPLALVENLGTAKRQMVEIVRAVRHNAQVFIFDEPTASLTPEETQHLFHLLNTLKERGAGIIFISHALEEALDIADRITVLRDGKLVATVAGQGHDARCAGAHDDRSRRDGEPICDARSAIRRARTAAKRGEKALSVENVTMGGVVKNMSFSVVRRRGRRHVRSGRRRPHRDRADHLRRAQAQLPARRHDLSAAASRCATACRARRSATASPISPRTASSTGSSRR